MIVPTTGAAGVRGWLLITTSSETSEVQPSALVTVNVYVPVARPVMVVLAPEPVEVIPPGSLVNVQVPVAGRLFNTTLPVDSSQVGWVIVPATGAAGVGGGSLITTSSDAADVQPSALVTVKVYVPAATPVMVVFAPVPVDVVPPGSLVSVQVPVTGRLLSATLPVDSSHVG